MISISSYARLSRPHQYIKNGFIGLPILFGNQLSQFNSLLKVFFAFCAFCLLASSVYIFNDIRDFEDDRQHPVKRNRPIASGEVSRPEALILMVILLAVSFIISFNFLPFDVSAILIAYFALNMAYSIKLKRLPILDVVCIAIGFVMRVFAGGKAADIWISPWIIIMTFLLALFLGLAKRYDDLMLSNQGHQVRKAMDGYNVEFVSLSMGVMASVTIVAYILYTVSPLVVEKHGPNLYVSAFWVTCGVLRYLQITFVDQKSGSPTQVLLHDRLLQLFVLLWLINVYYLLYW